MQICPFFFCFLFDFQTFSIYNVLFIVGCRGERTVRIRKVEGSIPFVSTTFCKIRAVKVRILCFFLHFISRNTASHGGVFSFDHKNTTDRNNFAFKAWSENLR